MAGDRGTLVEELQEASREHDRAIVGLSTGPAEASPPTIVPPDDAYRSHLVEALHDASRDYDQAILTLAAGTLALSVTFAHDITTKPAPGSPTLLLISWVVLALALVAIVASLLTSQHDLRNLIADVDAGKDNVGGDLNRPAAWWTQRLNIAAGIGLVIGLVFLGWYALVNVGGGSP